MKARSILLLALAGIFGLLLLILLLIVGSYFALRSPSVTAALVPRVQQLVKDSAGIDTTFGDVSIDLLGHIDLKDVTAKNPDMDIAVPRLILDYSPMALLDGQLEVDQFRIDQPSIKMTLKDDGKEPPAPPEDEPSQPLPQLIDQWLNDPPAYLNIKDVSINDADINVTMLGPHTDTAPSSRAKTALVLNDLSAKLSTQHEKGALTANLALDLAKDQPQAIEIVPPTVSKESASKESAGKEGGLDLRLNPYAALDVQLTLKELAKGSWQLDLAAPKLTLDADKLRFASTAPDAEMKATLDSHRLSAKLMTTVALKTEGELDDPAAQLSLLPGLIDLAIDAKEQGVAFSQKAVAIDPETGAKTPTSLTMTLDNAAVSVKDKTTSLATGALPEFLKGLTTDLGGKVALNKLRLTQGEAGASQPITVNSVVLDLKSAIKKGVGDVAIALDTDQLQGLPGLNKKLAQKPGQNPSLKAKVNGDLDFHRQNFALKGSAGDQFGNSLSFDEAYSRSAKGEPALSTLSHNIAFNLTEAIDRYLPQPVLKGDVGYYRGSLVGSTTIKGPVDLFNIDIDRYAAYPAQADIDLTLVQKKPGTKRLLVHPKPIKIGLDASYGAGASSNDTSQARTIDAKLSVAGDSIALKGLKGYVPLRLNAAVAAPVDITTTPVGLAKAKAKADVKVGRGLPQAAALVADISNSPKRLGLKANLDGNISRQLVSLLPPLAKAKLFGNRYYGLWRANGAWQGTVRHPHQTILSFKPGDEARSRVNLTGKLSLNQTAKGKLARLKAPVVLNHAVTGSMGQGKLNAKLSLPDAQLTGLTGVRGLSLATDTNYKLNLRHKTAPLRAVDTVTRLKIARLSPSAKVLPIKGVDRFLNAIDLDLQGSLAEQDAFTLKKLRLTSKAAGKDAVYVDVKGNGSIKNLALQAAGKLRGDFPQGAVAGVGLKGRATVPFSVTASRNAKKHLANLALAISPEFKNFSVTMPDIEIANLSGTFSVDEQIIANTKTKRAKFRYIQSRDPFKRVDYGRIEPFLQQENMISADKIRFGKAELGPLRANLSIDQNHVTLPYIATEVLDGWYVGKMFLDFKPSQLKLGYLGRITQINLGKLLPSTSGDDSKRFSSRLGLELDINRALLEGKIDVTEIGKTQLLQVLDVLDPGREDAKLNQARAGLAVGSPSYLGLGFQQGLMDMDIQFEAALVPNMNIVGIPLTSFIEANLSPFKKTLSQLPLE